VPEISAFIGALVDIMPFAPRKHDGYVNLYAGTVS
jgi:hypothetical protein